MIRVLYFASVRQKTGIAEEELAADGLTTLGDLRDALRARGAAYEAALPLDKSLRAAVNQQFADFDAPVKDGDEVAFFPPVTGG